MTTIDDNKRKFGQFLTITPLFTGAHLSGWPTGFALAPISKLTRVAHTPLNSQFRIVFSPASHTNYSIRSQAPSRRGRSRSTDIRYHDPFPGVDQLTSGTTIHFPECSNLLYL